MSNTGLIQWQKCLGGSDDDYFSSLFHSNNGGFIVFNYTNSTDGDVSGYHGEGDSWAVKLDINGSIQWQKCLGGSNLDASIFEAHTSDGDFILSGYTYSTDGDVSGHHGEGDIWAVKINNAGIIRWQKCLGGSNEEYGFLKETADGGFITIGLTASNDGDVSGLNGFANIWIAKLGPTTATEEQESKGDWKFFPNPTSDYLTLFSEDAVGEHDLKIIDAFGRIVFVRSDLHLQQSVSLNLSELTDGVYHCVIQGVHDLINVGKIVKVSK